MLKGLSRFASCHEGFHCCALLGTELKTLVNLRQQLSSRHPHNVGEKKLCVYRRGRHASSLEASGDVR
jgi:hypothetical protein